MRYTKILGTGSYLPEKVLTNYDLEKQMDTTHEWIVERTGISERRLVSENENSTTMAIAAAKNAVEAANINKDDIGIIIVATCTPEYFLPNTAALVQQALELPFCPAFDVSVACAGFIYALSTADQYIKNGAVDYALIIGVESMSRIVDWEDRSSCILFGDGAGAMVLGPSDEPGILSSHLHAAGQYGDLLSLKTDINEPHKHLVKMMGRDVFKLAVKYLGEAVEEALAAHDMEKEEIDWLVPHQANFRIINAMAKKLSLPMEKVILTVDVHGNTSSASVPLAFDVGVRDGRIQRGQTILMDAFGGGLAWGSTLLRY